ncbi:DUF2267 domain-containing protein [Natronococcus occultus]|uniref:DUF2267 domain-containing protein n=1 Tax=Natronococcus occultus SP4 TaxID=694430 RepID=L0JT93_9EURY|nr:DUF2267 domain-containing protein [Natronococcus occultus]AGB36232.1 hypothetical protein Natoc_0367 [Natronococcus occultus SP4]
MATEYAEFIGEVQHRIDAGTRAEAVRTTRAVLETLGERVGEGGATDIASPLPLEIDRYLLQVEHGQRHDLDAFVDRAHERLNYEDLELETDYSRPSGVDRADATSRTKAVLALLSEVVPGGEIANVESQLPEEFEELFELVDAETQPWEAQ